MPESIIRADAEVVTLINVFTVDREDQLRLVELWQDATERVMRHLPGFVSANVHRSLDGMKVVNYAQWENQEAFTAMLQNPGGQALPYGTGRNRDPRSRPVRGGVGAPCLRLSAEVHDDNATGIEGRG